MRISNLILPSLKEIPADAVIASHQLMLRAGLIRKMSSGIYSYLPLGLKALRKVETVVREEMDRAGAQEFLLPLLLPREIWEETGRWTLMNDLMLKVHDRAGKDSVLAPTAEEGFTALIRDELKSWRQLPVTVYQIGKKFRDEIRPRFGVMRGREFMMKDAYSFDRDEKDLDASYEAMREAYLRIFKRLGLEVIRVEADSGAMGGSGSEEFMVPSKVGENEIAVCQGCKKAANLEAARCQTDALDAQSSKEDLKQVATPSVRTIEELCDFFSCQATSFIKSLLYRYEKDGQESFVMTVIRGDLEVNEIKLANHLGATQLDLATEDEVRELTGAEPGFAGPVGFKSAPILADLSLKGLVNGITGANRSDSHYRGVNHQRDWMASEWIDLRTVRAGDPCLDCGGELAIFRGIEVGHIFKLGDKYTRAMGVSFSDEDGKERVPIMGCYGIGIDRSLASVIEQHHDQDGIKWPPALAPYDLVIVPINWSHPETQEVAIKLETQLEDLGLSVLVDDRDARAGFKFKDADLFGFPIRVTIGEKTLATNEIEWKTRIKGESGRFSLDQAAQAIKDLHQSLLKG